MSAHDYEMYAVDSEFSEVRRNVQPSKCHRPGSNQKEAECQLLLCMRLATYLWSVAMYYQSSGFCCDCMNQAAQGTQKSDHKNTFLSLLSLKQQGSNNCFSAVCPLNKKYLLHSTCICGKLVFASFSLFYFFRPQPWITRGYWDQKGPDMMFYKCILDSFSTSQFVFNKGRQCRAGRQKKMVCNWILSLQNHQPPILIPEGLSSQEYGSFRLYFGRLLCYYANTAMMVCFIHLQHGQVFLHLSRKSQSQMRCGGAIFNPL